MDTSCPFCGTALRDVSAPHGLAATVLLGLALMGCGDSTGAEEGNGESANTMSATGETESETSSSSASGTESTTQNVETAEASDYGGPEATSDPDETGPLPESSSDETSGSDSTGTDSSSSDTSGTDTGATTTGGSAEGADYGAPPGR